MDHFGNASSTEYCIDYCQYENLQKHQNITITDSETPRSLLGLLTKETAECHYCKREYGISRFQKLLIDGRIKLLKTCQSCRSGDCRYCKQHCLKVDVDHRTANPRIEITQPTYENNHTNDPDCVDPDIHLAAAEQVQNPFACVP
jgi:hypothetical protein